LANKYITTGQPIVATPTVDKGGLDGLVLFSRYSLNPISPTLQVGAQPYLIKAFGLAASEVVTVNNFYEATGLLQPVVIDGNPVTLSSNNTSVILYLTGNYRFSFNATLGDLILTATRITGALEPGVGGGPIQSQQVLPNPALTPGQPSSVSNNFNITNMPWVFRAYGLMSGTISVLNVYTSTEGVVTSPYAPDGSQVVFDVSHNTIVLDKPGVYQFQSNGTDSVLLIGNPSPILFVDPYAAEAAEQAAAAAAASAAQAAAAATSAAGSASQAVEAAEEAEVSAEAAATSASEAATSATQAEGSAVAAAGSASAAAESASEAATSAAAAATSETNAAASAASAAASATAAAGSEASASASASEAAASATAAAGSASAAASSATAAATSEANAASSATEASDSATSAAGSATSAAGSASTATTQATNAALSSASAAASAAAAAESAAQAGAGQTFELVCQVPISANQVVAASGGYAYIPDLSNSADVCNVVGVALQSGVTGASIKVTQQATLMEAGWAWTPGRVYCTTTGGALTQVPPTSPSAILEIGRALSTNTVQVDLQPIAIFI
jgi:hypothetical protein